MKILVIGDSIIKKMGDFLRAGLRGHDLTFAPLPGYKIEGQDDSNLLKNEIGVILWLYYH